MQKVFHSIVVQFDGTPFKNEKGSPLTVSEVIVQSLLAGFEDERGLSGEEKLKRYILAERIHSTGATPTEVSSEDVTLIKQCVGKAFATSVVGFVFRYLEGDESVPVRGPRKVKSGDAA